MTRINIIKTLSLASVLLIFLLETLLVYVQRVHLTYMSRELVFFPLFLMSVSLIVTFLFLIRVKCSHFSTVSIENPKHGLKRFFQVSYLAIKETLREKTYMAIAIVAAFSYALLFSLAQGLLIQSSFEPYFQIINEGPPGYAPIFMFSPVNGVGFVVSTYQLTVLGCLSLFTGVNIAVFSRVYTQRRELEKQGSLKLSLAGASTGLLVACPTCVTPPIMILLSTLLWPLTSSLDFTILGEVIKTTILYSLSLFLLLIGLSSASTALHSGLECQIEHRSTR